MVRRAGLGLYQVLVLEDQYPEFRRIWEEEMLLIRADDTAFWHMEEPDVARFRTVSAPFGLRFGGFWG